MQGSLLQHYSESLPKAVIARDELFTNAIQETEKFEFEIEMASSSKLPQSVYDPRRHVGVHSEWVSDVSNTEYPGHYPDEDHSWDLEKFKEVSA